MIVDQIKSAIVNKNIKVVSFDIFDTLLERPSVYPLDIMALLNDPISQMLGRKIDFYKIRLNLEDEAKDYYKSRDEDITFKEIYDYFQKKYRLTDNQRNFVENLELDLELDLLSPRKAVKELYELAVSNGKKVICISDMYHSSDFIFKLLEKNAYFKISNVYVSSEIKKKKDSGEIFNYVLDCENIKPHEIIHIGDNRNSDFLYPLKKGIVAYHVPSSKDLFFSSKSEYSEIWRNLDRFTPFKRIFIGFYINRWAEKIPATECFFPSKYDLGYFGLGLILFLIALKILNNEIIQNDYEMIYFASRDGYLPMEAYKMLSEGKAKIKSRYLYAGRNLYTIAFYDDSPIDLINKRIKQKSYDPCCTLGLLFDSLIGVRLFEKNDPEYNILLSDKKVIQTTKKIISLNKNFISELLLNKKKGVNLYYNKSIQFNKQDRAVVFDCGYSGSVSDAIGRITDKKIDKVYIWETEKNKRKDKKNKTKTFLLSGGLFSIPFSGFELVLEELFSPLEGSCVGITDLDNGFKPVFDESTVFSDLMREDLSAIHKGALDFVKDINNFFSKYFDSFSIETIDFTFEPLAGCLRSKRDLGIRHLENILFPDPYYGINSVLADKIEEKFFDFFKRTEFTNKKRMLAGRLNYSRSSGLKIAIHLHLYFIEQAYEFIERLKEIDYPYDLLISVCSEQGKRQVEVMFNSAILGTLQNLIVKVFPNRGRDVAPLFVGFKDEQKNYDLMCHVHSKKSPHFSWGDDWKNYLLDNLISADAVHDIIYYFDNDPEVGLVFPPIYKGLYEFWISHNLTPLEEKDKLNCQYLLEKMKISYPAVKQSVYFSAGTMFWYRPDSLMPLFQCGLDFDDFPLEPIDITGSLAHAIERLPAIVADSQGYKTSFYVTKNYLSNYYFNNSYFREDKTELIVKYKSIQRIKNFVETKLVNYLPEKIYRLLKKLYQKTIKNWLIG